MFEAFLEREVSEIVGAEFVAQEGGELLVLFEESIFPVGAEDMMAVLDLLQGGVELAWQAAGEAGGVDFRVLVRRKGQRLELAAALEGGRGGGVAFEGESTVELGMGGVWEGTPG